MNPHSFPRLLFVADVPVEASFHGSALLYRLLQDYPADKLLVVERQPIVSKPERRLPGVEYRILPRGMTRFLSTRLHNGYVPVYFSLAGLDARMIGRMTRDFRPEAVLSVHHGYTWAAAARLAKQQALPLHLILHDDASTAICAWKTGRSLGETLTQQAYKQAASRLCVSPFMEEEYARRYGERGTLLYPGRAKDAPAFSDVAPRIKHPAGTPTVAYGGNIYWQGYAEALKAVSLALEPLGGRLILFGPHHPEMTRRWGLNRPNVEFRGLVTSAQMIQAFRDEADCLFVPMSFEAEDRRNMEISFPSKLTDSTIPGVPLLIYGPPYSSVVRWARENAGVAEVVDSCEPESLRAALKKILGSVALRQELGQAAMLGGRKYFGYETCRDIFFGRLTENGGLP